MFFETPQSTEKRLKAMVFGGSNSGKTSGIIQFPNSAIIDTEGGTDEYQKTIIAKGSKVFRTTSFHTAMEAIQWLKTSKHSFRTLSIDSATILHQDIKEKTASIFDKHETKEKTKDLQDYGFRYHNQVKTQWKKMWRELISLDMNVLVTDHIKDKYQGMNRVGDTFDSDKDDEYVFSYVFKIENKTGNIRGMRTAVLAKERAEIGEPKFPDEFDWTYENFCKYYGKEIIEREAKPIVYATQESVDELVGLVTQYNVPQEWISKWKEKVGEEEFGKFTEEQIKTCVDFVNKKVKEGKLKAEVVF